MVLPAGSPECAWSKLQEGTPPPFLSGEALFAHKSVHRLAEQGLSNRSPECDASRPAADII